jgi:multicomponent K+:H+ antiporter subunit G
MTSGNLPIWALVPAAILLMSSGLVALVGSLGLLRLGTFLQRMHGASMGSTLGVGCALLGSMILSSALAERIMLHELVIAVLVFLTSPMSAMMLARAALARSKSQKPTPRLRPRD